MLEWRNETLKEFAKRQQSKVPIEGMMMHSYSAPVVFQEMLAKRHMESIQVQEIDAPQGDAWPQHMLTLLNSDHPFAGIKKNIAAIQQIDVENEEAITVSFYDFLQISIEQLKSRFGGMVNTSFLLAIARKGK